MLELMPPFYFLTFAKVSVSVSKKFGLKKVSVSVSKTFGLEKKSRYQSRKHLVSKKSLSICLENARSRKKSRYGSRTQFLVSSFSANYHHHHHGIAASAIASTAVEAMALFHNSCRDSNFILFPSAAKRSPDPPTL